MSIKQSDTHTRPDLIILGKNFVRGTRVVFKQMSNDSPDEVKWQEDAEIEAAFFTQVNIYYLDAIN